MIRVNIQRNKIGLEDLLVGLGTEKQVRGPNGTAEIEITRINGANLPYDSTYSLQEKLDTIEDQIENLPVVVDQNGNLLTGLVDISPNVLIRPSRIWIRTIDDNRSQAFLGEQLMFEFDPTSGNLLVPGNTDYIAADSVLQAALQANIDTLESEVNPVRNLGVGTGNNNLVQLDGSGRLPAVDGSQLTGIDVTSGNAPVGSIFEVPYNYVDNSVFKKANGQELNRTEFSALFTVIGITYGDGNGSTTFNLPDYRGYFRRSWDDGRGIDAGRTLGSIQNDEIKAHTHTGQTNSAGAHTHNTIVKTGGAGPTGIALGSGVGTNTFSGTDHISLSGNHNHSFTTNSTGGSETRPKNISTCVIMKVV